MHVSRISSDSARSFSMGGGMATNRACAATIVLGLAAALGAGGCGSSDGNGSGGGAGEVNLIQTPPNTNGNNTPITATAPADSAYIDGTNRLGAYALGDEVGGSGIGDTGVSSGSSDQGCSTLVGVVRDFRGVTDQGGHPDFEVFQGAGATKGLVLEGIGTDAKPVYASRCETGGNSAACPYGQQTTSQANFDQWYRFTEGVNKPYLVYFKFGPNGNVYTFQSDAFFPLDGTGWGNLGRQHNFHFTTELHTKFTYQGGETFSFTGDDDLWVFINGKLAIDLGGLHEKVTEQVSLDQAASKLGIQRGNVYSLELFHAERHTVDSNFRLDTNLVFVDCGTVAPDIH